jgi:hypothetical protein
MKVFTGYTKGEGCGKGVDPLPEENLMTLSLKWGIFMLI